MLPINNCAKNEGHYGKENFLKYLNHLQKYLSPAVSVAFSGCLKP